MNASVVEDAVHVDGEEAELVGRSEDLRVPLEANSLHFHRLIELVLQDQALAEAMLLLHHGEHVLLVLQLHGDLEHDILDVVGASCSCVLN